MSNLSKKLARLIFNSAPVVALIVGIMLGEILLVKLSMLIGIFEILLILSDGKCNPSEEIRDDEFEIM